MFCFSFFSDARPPAGLGLLFDVRSVFVWPTHQLSAPFDYVGACPFVKVGGILLGGRDEVDDDHGARLLIDSHGKPVVDPVWALYDHTIARGGAKPTLIEWDTDVPEWRVLAAEAARANAALAQFAQ